MKRTSCALALALVGALLVLQPVGTTLAQETIKQLALNAKQVEGFIAAQKDLAELAKKIEGTKSDQPDPKAQAEVEAIAKKHASKLKQMAKGESADARIVVLRTLATSQDLQHVPMFISSLSDSNPDVVIEARDGLRRISRKFKGFGMSDAPTEDQRQAAIDQ